MPSFTVVKADHKKDFDGKFGRMSVYELSLDEGDGSGITLPCELTQKQSSQPPMPGERLEGQIIPSGDPDWLPNFKKDYNPGGGGRSGGGGGSTFKPRDPSEIAGARHAHNLLVAAHCFERIPFGSLSDADFLKSIRIRLENLEAFACVLDEKTAAISDAAKGT